MILIKKLITDRKAGWQDVRNEVTSVGSCYAKYLIPLAAIGPIAAVIGVTQIGWQVGGAEEPVTMTMNSALQISIATFAAILVVIMILGKTIRWMSSTYEGSQSMARCVALATFSAAPLFLSGISLLLPIPWLVYLIGLAALGYSVALLYSGVPIMMEVNEEKGFLFASAILALALVSLVGLLAVTVGFWSFGIGPVFST